MPRVLADFGTIPLFEPLDTQAGVDSETFHFGNAPEVSMLLQFGVVTGDSVLTMYCGATAGTKTTAIPFRYRLSGADYKAAAADAPWGAWTDSVAGGTLTLTAATYDHRMLEICLEAAAIPDGKPWITVEIDGTATALLMAGVAFARPARYQPAPTMVPTT